MSRKLIISILLIINFNFGYSQKKEINIDFVAYWKLGDSYDFKVTKIKENKVNNSKLKSDTIEYIANFKVIDSTLNSYKIQWMLKENILTNYSKIFHEIINEKNEVDKILSDFNFSKIICQTNEYGELIAISNWEEIREFMIKAFDEFRLKLTHKYPNKKEKIETAIKTLIDIYTSKLAIEEVVFDEFNFFYFPMGVQLNLNTPLEYEGELPNILGQGDPIKTETKITVDTVNFDDHYCEFTESVNLNIDDAKRQTILLLKRMGINGDKAAKNINDKTFTITESNCYQFYYNPCIPYKITSIKQFILNVPNSNIENTEKLIIEQL